jgi:hypothetical protein
MADSLGLSYWASFSADAVSMAVAVKYRSGLNWPSGGQVTGERANGVVDRLFCVFTYPSLRPFRLRSS